MTRSPRRRGGKSSTPSDPYFEREAQKYANPIPSREFILGVLEERGAPMSHAELAAELKLEGEEQLDALSRRLRAMERDAQVVRNRREGYGLPDKMDLKAGRVQGHPDGFGFLIPDDGSPDIFLHARQMRSLIHGDRALVRISGKDFKGRPEGAVVEVLERNTHTVVGRYFEEGGVGVVVPDERRIRHDVLIPPERRNGAEQGQIVVVELVEQPAKRTPPVGRIVEVLGEHMAPGMEIDVAIRAHGLPVQWPQAVREQIAGLSEEVPEEAKAGRVDLRELPLVTIDGADARDFDDAVYCQATPKGWKLIVAIADVSHYVEPDSALDQEAKARSTSVYFPERVLPMLPEILSNGLCSINPQVDRLCMCCEMLVNRDGKMVRSSFFEGVMRSHARLIYDDVAAMVVDGDARLRRRYAELVPHLEELYRLYQVLRQARDKRGAIDFETTETRIVFGPEKKIEQIVPLVRNDAHKLIEECMILANVAAARFLSRHKIPALYRVHDGPKAEKLDDLREFLAELGLKLKGGLLARLGLGGKPEPKHYAELLRRVADRPDAHLIQTVLLRSMKQAVYTPDNIGHFGLAHDYYAHFTSPIRRYPDLMVHRAIRHLLRGGKAKNFRYGHVDLVTLGEHCSAMERRADEATRDAVSWLKCEYMLDKVGEEFSGIITAVTGFGCFVELDRIYVEGLVHITGLGSDYFHFDAVHHRLIGERTHKVFRLGDPLRVKVVRVNLDDRKIDFELAGAAAERRGRSRSQEKPKAQEGAKPKSRRGGAKSRRRRKGGGEPRGES